MFKFIGAVFKKSQPAIKLNESLQQQLNSYLDWQRPNKKALLKDLDLVAVDFETTGLDATTAEIISMGFSSIKQDCIPLAKCEHIVVKTSQILSSENVAIHGLTDDQVSQGISAEDAFCKFLGLTQKKIIVAHYHQIEVNFIQTLSKKITGRTIPMSILDTFFIARRQMERRQQLISQDSLRLFNLRRQLGLPNYKAHNALEDAISTAELFLAQKASTHIKADKIRLRDLKLFNYS